MNKARGVKGKIKKKEKQSIQFFAKNQEPEKRINFINYCANERKLNILNMSVHDTIRMFNICWQNLFIKIPKPKPKRKKKKTKNFN